MRALWMVFAFVACGGSDKSVGDSGAAAMESDADADADSDVVDVWYPANDVGPFGVGSLESSLTGRTGEHLRIQVWYPTDENSSMLHQYDGMLTHDALDSPEPLCDQTRPVVVFSHGNQGIRWQSNFITERLATHGFVVVAPDHTGNTIFDFSEDRLPEMIFRRPYDVIDSVDWLFQNAAVDLGLEGCLDEADGYAVMGHSFGGYTATAVGGAAFDFEASVAFCEAAGGWLCDEFQSWVESNPEFANADFSDDRAWAAIPLAPAGFEVLGAGAPLAEIPFMVLGAEWDNMTPMATQVEPIFNALGSETKVMGNLLSSGHMIFSQACEWTNYAECNEPYLSLDEGGPTINTAVTAFLQMQLGNPAAEEFMPYNSDLWEWTRP
jgi:predicted dienelactone hydrolase